MGKVKQTRQLDLQNHCLFCLRPQDQGTLLEVAGRDPQGLSRDLQPIVNYLTGGGWGREEGEEDSVKEDAVPVIKIPANLPPVMCPACHGILAELYRLHRERLRIQWLIQKQTELARREIVAKTRTRKGTLPVSILSPREEFYLKLRPSWRMSSEEVTAVTELVDKLHDQIALEASGNKPVKFPAQISSTAGSSKSSASAFEPGKGSSQKLSSAAQSAGPSGGQLFPSKPLPLRDPLSSDEDKLMEGIIPIKEETEAPDQFSELDNFFLDAEDVAAGNALPVVSSEEVRVLPEPPSPPTGTVRGTISVKSKSPSSKPSEPATKSGAKRKKANAETRIRKRPLLVLPLVKTGSGTSQHCDLCKELCPSSEIRIHLEAYHNVGDFIVNCPNPSCPYVFSCRGKLEKHLSGGGSWAANKCRRKGNVPPTLPFRTCQDCGFQTKFVVEFEKHLKTHESGVDDSEKNLPCPIPGCKKKCALWQSVEQHLFTHDYEDEVRRLSRRRPVKEAAQNCDLCGEEIPISEIVHHLEETHHVKEYMTRCPNPSCPKVFSCQVKMEKHLETPTYKTSACRIAAKLPVNRPGITCQTCGLEVSRTRYQNHLQRHECQMADKSLPCPIPGCPERYALRQSMEEHLFIHDFRPPKQADQECSICKEMIPVEQISTHLKEAHEVVEVIPCRRCHFRFHDWEPLLDHLSEHRHRSKTGSAGGGGFSCDLCNSVDEPAMNFLRYDSLRAHFFNVHKIGKQFLCEHCDLEFFSQQSLSSHQQNQHSSKSDANNPTTTTSAKAIRTYKCDLCPGILFSNQYLLINHNFREHGAAPPTCKFCSKQLPSYHSLRKHEQAHMGLGRTYKCRVENCSKVFHSKTKLKYHEKGDHRDALAPKLFVCDSCGKGFNNPMVLRGHVRQVHSGKKPPRSICDTCGESFANAAILRRHDLIHSGARPHQCTICGQAFRHSNVLATHLKGHQEKGNNFRPNGPMKNIRKRVEKKSN